MDYQKTDSQKFIIDKLQRENSILSSTIVSLKTDIKLLQQSNKLLQESNQKLTEELTRLKDRLGLNSTNSSLPPSKDLYKTKRKNRPKSKAKPGGQPGHKANFYKPIDPKEVINLFPEICECGHKIKVLEDYTRKQKIEIPKIEPEVKEYRQYHGICTGCNKKIVAPMPVGVSKDLLGPNAKAIICSLNGFFQNSKREVQGILKDIFNLPISLGLISKTAERVNQALEKEYSNIEKEIVSSGYLHIDETGHKMKGERGWGWIFTTRSHSLLKLSNSRGKKVLEEVLENKYNGYVISDRYGAYTYFSADKRQICWSHLQRDFERFAHSSDASLSAQGHKLVDISKEVFGLKKALEGEVIKERYFVRRIKKLKKRLQYIFNKILRIRGIPQAHRVIKRLEKSFGLMWLFVKNRSIEMTNNLAERQLRKYVVYRKKLLFTWSEWGNRFVERILSLYLTAGLRKVSPFRQLYLAIVALT